MSNQNSISRGSVWRKWDLQVHTKGTAKNDQFTSANFDEFCIALFKKALEKEIAVIGITDYFSIENYKKVKKFVAEIDNLKVSGKKVFSDQEIEAIKGIFILPNVELRMMPSTDSGRLVNIHCLFNPEFESSIENDFFGSIEYSAGSGTRFKMNRQGIISLGKSLDSTLVDEAAYKKGADNFVVSHGDLQKLYDGNTKFRENVIIVVSNSSKDGASALQKHYDLFENDVASQLDAVRKAIYSISHAIFSSNENDRKYFLGSNGKDDVAAVINKCGSLKPCVHGSDAHSEDKLFAPDNNLFCWIKADTTFEGLKQILWEPKERVRIQERDPSDSKSKRIIIDKAIYKHSADDEKTVYFNPDLNSIIGSRGSGKSTLLKNLAYKIDATQFSEKDKKKPYPLDGFKVVWLDGQNDSGTEESPKSIFYIPQNYLSSLAYDDGEKVNERDQFLTKLLKKNVRFANAIQSFDNFTSKNKVKIEELIQQLITADTTQRETRELSKKQGSKTEIEQEIKKKNEKIKKYKDDTGSAVTDEELKTYSKANKIVSEGEKKLAVLNQDKEILENLKNTGANIFVSSQEFSLLSAQRQELIKIELTKKGKESLDDLIKKEIISIEKLVIELNKDIKEKSKDIKALGDKIKKSKALEDLTKELSALEKTIEKIDELSGKLKVAENDRTVAIEGLVQAYADFDLQQEAIYKTIKFDENFSFLKIEIIAKYNTQQIKIFVEKNINTRDSDPDMKLEDDIKQLFGELPALPSNETIKKILSGLMDGRIKIKVEANDVSTVISQLLKNRYEIDYLNSVKTQDGEICFKDMTGGQKAIALLELIFKFDDEFYPILIDQPEDDLDDSGVATDLVDFIKSEKQDRQIIIVTHNASLVVCADTEEVIMSQSIRVSSGNFNFSYSTGAIENPSRRENIIKVLEGGREALKMRARKLDFKHEI